MLFTFPNLPKCVFAEVIASLVNLHKTQKIYYEAQFVDKMRYALQHKKNIIPYILKRSSLLVLLHGIIIIYKMNLLLKT